MASIHSREDDQLQLAALRRALRDVYGQISKEADGYEAKIETLIAERDAETERLSDEIEVLTTERDNALLRIEELEAELVDWHGTRGLDMENPYGGGVNPNA